MPLNGLTPAPGLIQNLAAHPVTGQLYMIAPNQHQLNQHQLSYIVTRPQILPSPLPQPPTTPQQQDQQAQQQLQLQLQIQHQLHQHQQQQQQLHQEQHQHHQHHQPEQTHRPSIAQTAQLHHQHQTTQPPSKYTPSHTPKAQTKDQTNAKVRNIKEKCITHYLDGQLIIETVKPLTTKKHKVSRKKKLSNIQSSQRSTQSPQQSQQLSQQQQPQQQQQQQQLQLQIQPQQSQSQPKLQPQQLTPQHPLPLQQQHSLTPQQQQSRDLNDVHKVRADMDDWTVADVVEFIERHDDIKQYSSKFADDEVDGKALLLLIDRNLNLQMLTSMFKHGPAMKIEAVLSKYKVPTQ